MKPDMDHLETRPDLYRKNETYISHDWNLSDVEGQIRRYLETGRYMIIARQAQDLYRKFLFHEAGQREFCARTLRLFRDEDTEPRDR